MKMCVPELIVYSLVLYGNIATIHVYFALFYVNLS